MDNYSVPYAALVIGFFEMVAIAWVYGIERHLKNIHKMMGFPVWPHLYWKCIAKFACPIIMATIFTLILVHHSPLTYNDYVFPTYSNVIGWILTLSSVIMIPIFALYEFSKVWLNRATYKVISNVIHWHLFFYGLILIISSLLMITGYYQSRCKVTWRDDSTFSCEWFPTCNDH